VQAADVTAPNSLFHREQAREWGRLLARVAAAAWPFLLTAAKLPLILFQRSGVIAALGDDADSQEQG
jgi:hypothetical protein